MGDAFARSATRKHLPPLTSLPPHARAEYARQLKAQIEPSRGLTLARVALDSCHNEASTVVSGSGTTLHLDASANGGILLVFHAEGPDLNVPFLLHAQTCFFFSSLCWGLYSPAYSNLPGTLS